MLTGFGLSTNPATLNGIYTSEAHASEIYDFKINGPSNTVVFLHIHAYRFVAPIIAGTGDGGLLSKGPDGQPSGVTGFSIKADASIHPRLVEHGGHELRRDVPFQ